MTIEYDYEIDRDEGDRRVRYRPDKIPRKLPELAYIKGPNSAGKSTLLNLIALGFYGEKNDRLALSLKEKLQRLKNSNYQKIRFDIKVYDRNNNLVLQSKKNDFNSEIEVYENRGGVMRRVDADRFFVDYNLIYDIPENPMSRLKDLTNEIRDLQNRCMNSIGGLETLIVKLIGEIEQRDPETIERLRERIANFESEEERKVRREEEEKQRITELEKYVYTRLATEYRSALDGVTRQLKNLKKEKRETGKQISEANNLWSEIGREAEILERIYYDLGPLLQKHLPKEEEYRLKLWNSINPGEMRIDLKVDSRFKSQIMDLKRIFENELKLLKESRTARETELVERLIGVLSEFEDDNINIPGVNIDVKSLLVHLEGERDRKLEETQKLKDMEEICSLLSDLGDKIRDAERKITQLKGIDENFTPDYLHNAENIERTEEQLKARQKEYSEKYDYYRSHCISALHITEDRIESEFESIKSRFPGHSSLDEEKLMSRLTEEKENLDSIERGIREIEVQLKSLKDELKRLEERKPHRYQDHKDDLNRLLGKCRTLRSALARYNGYLSDLMNGRLPKGDENDVKNYLEKLSTYLGRRMATMRFINEVYKVKKVDLVNRVVLTEEGKRISFDDMGTGQSQSAYLSSILNVNDRRKMIVLLDEVAMMDKTSLKPVFDMMRSLYQQGKLVMGLVVQIEPEGRVEVKDLLEDI